MLQLTVGKDNRSTPVYGLPMTDEGWNASLTAATDTFVTVPIGTRFALIAADDHYFVSAESITLPTAGAGFGAQNAEQDKQIVFYPEGSIAADVLHVISRNATDISISFFS
jgi:hypothetical protein